VEKNRQKKRSRGRPTKKSATLVNALIRLITNGGPYELCCSAVGITRETFCDWRRSDSAFAEQVEKATAEGSLARLKKIERHGNKDWHALGWMLERRHPEFFARAEAQLNVIAQAAVVNGNGAPLNVQTVVVSDLEFVGLKRHPAYTHRPGVVREAEQVSPELAGTLERENENIVVTSESAAKAKARRYAEIHARTKELLDAHSANTAKTEAPVKGQLSPDLDGSLYREDQNIVAVSESKVEAQKRRLAEAKERLDERHSKPLAAQISAVPQDGAPVQEPFPDKPSSWWRRFLFPGVLIPKLEATEALRIVLAELRIVADEQVLDFATPNVVQSTFCQMLERLTGGDLGWRTAIQIYERAQARERLWADH
jgi:hypothetical protein